MKDEVLREEGTRPLVSPTSEERIMACAERGIDHATKAWRVLQQRGLEPYGTETGTWPPTVAETYSETLGYQVAELIRALWEIHVILSPTPPEEEPEETDREGLQWVE